MTASVAWCSCSSQHQQRRPAALHEAAWKQLIPHPCRCVNRDGAACLGRPLQPRLAVVARPPGRGFCSETFTATSHDPQHAAKLHAIDFALALIVCLEIWIHRKAPRLRVSSPLPAPLARFWPSSLSLLLPRLGLGRAPSILLPLPRPAPTPYLT